MDEIDALNKTIENVIQYLNQNWKHKYSN
jgi:hypothetical protein